MKKNIHEQVKKLQEHRSIAISGHRKRIKEQKKIIQEAKRAIKMHKLLIKQAKVSYKLQELEATK